MTNFQNANGVFGSKMAPLNWWAEFDAPKVDAKLGMLPFWTQYSECIHCTVCNVPCVLSILSLSASRGVNRWVVLLNAQPTNANKATMKILKVFMTNDHYGM